MPPTASPRTTGFRSAAGEAASWRPSRNPCPTRADTTSTSKATSSTRRPNRASCGCRLEHVARFVPKINNWAVCDCFCWRLKAAERQPMWEFIQPYFRSEAEYDVRFAVVTGLGNFVDGEHLEALLQLLDGVRHEAYYARMAVAWAVSVCYIKFPQRTHEWLGSCSLDDWTFNKSLQKIVESLRVSDTDKQAIRAMKRRKQATSRAAVNPRPGTETAGQAEKRPGQAPKQPTDGKTAARRRRPAEKQGARHRFAK